MPHTSRQPKLSMIVSIVSRSCDVGLTPARVVAGIEASVLPAQALPSRVKKLREGGLATLRELQKADEEASKAEADLPADVDDETEHLVKEKYVLA